MGSARTVIATIVAGPVGFAVSSAADERKAKRRARKRTVAKQAEVAAEQQKTEELAKARLEEDRLERGRAIARNQTRRVVGDPLGISAQADITRKRLTGE